MNKIAVVTKFCSDLIYPDAVPGGGKYNPAARRFGGAGATVVPILAGLNEPVAVFGRVTEDDKAARRTLERLGIEFRAEYRPGPGAINAVVPGEFILRVQPGPAYNLSAAESLYIAGGSLAAVAVAGSHTPDYAQSWIVGAAARGVPCFWNPGGGAPLGLAGQGRTIVQVSYAEYGQGQESPEDLVRRLLHGSHAAGVVVTDARHGSYGMMASDTQVIHVPAVPIGQPRQEVGAGDAYFAVFLATYRSAPPVGRLERAMQAGTLGAARHVMGLPPSNWGELRQFELDLIQPTVVRQAA